MYVARTTQSDTVDQLCLRVHGRLAPGIVEATLEENRGLADYGPLLPAGLEVRIPDLPDPQDTRIQLWD
ncbi:tail protein X [Guyparkeria halopsychrophila]|uniref:tail protein X n=1 Tax=Guyparkeria halopsychrophila TaxID=3139421 RepID=UPI0037CA295D